MAYEGSTEVDGGNLPYNSDVSENDTDTGDDETKTGEGENQDQAEGEGEGEDKTQLTEKGTKLDPNPQSAIHQQLANAKRQLQNYEKVLSSPDLLRRYAKESGMTLEEAKAEIKEEKSKYAPENFKSAQDLANAFNELQGNFGEFTKTISELREENRRLKEGLSGIEGSQRVARVANNMHTDVSTIREKFSVLNPKSPDYDPVLEKEIGSFYHKLDAVDPSDPTKGYKGDYSLADITETFMRIRGIGAKQGSQQAQTIVKTKQAGKVVTSGKASTKETTNPSDPGTSIAQKIAKTLGNT